MTFSWSERVCSCRPTLDVNRRRVNRWAGAPVGVPPSTPKGRTLTDLESGSTPLVVGTEPIQLFTGVLDYLTEAMAEGVASTRR